MVQLFAAWAFHHSGVKVSIRASDDTKHSVAIVTLDPMRLHFPDLLPQLGERKFASDLIEKLCGFGGCCRHDGFVLGLENQPQHRAADTGQDRQRPDDQRRERH